MPRSVVESPAARRDVARYAVYRSQQSTRRADPFLRAVWQTYQQLARTPGLGGAWETTNPDLVGLRVFPVKKHPNHLIFFLPFDDRIEIVRVLHGAQDLELVFGAE